MKRITHPSFFPQERFATNGRAIYETLICLATPMLRADTIRMDTLKRIVGTTIFTDPMQPGFTAGGTNTYFHGFIHGCNHAGNSFNRYTHSTGGGKNNTGNNFVYENTKEKKLPELIILPNPNSGNFTLNILNKFNPENAVEIFDISGRKVYNKDFVKQKELLNLELENGTYLIKYYDGINAHSQMIIINK